jgi:hypothetical protein
MADKIEYSRLLLKRTNIAGVTPTIPPVSATTLNQFTPTDIFVGEMFANVEDDRFWIRTNTGIVELNTSGGTSGSTGTSGTSGTSGINGTSGTSGVGSGAFLPLSGGTVTGDTTFTEKLYLTNLTSGGSSTYLTVDSDTGQVYTALSSGGSGTSGTSGTSGINGTSGTNGANGTSGVNGTSGTSGVSGLGLYLPLSGGTVTGDTTFTEKLYLTNLTSGGSSTYLTVDSDTGQVYTALSSGGSGTSGTSGSSGVNGTSGTSGGGGGGASGGSHFGWTLSPGNRYNLAYTSEYREIEWTQWASQITLIPFTPGRNVSISAITMTNTNANGYTDAALVMCAYEHNIATNLPGDLILSSSTIPITTNFTQNTFATNYTFSAGTTYWLGYAFNTMTASGGIVAGYAHDWIGLMTFGAAINPPGGDEVYKMAINTSFTFPNLPDPFTGTRYVGQNNPPEICIIPSA